MAALIFLINFIFGIIETLLSVRFVLRLLGANSAAPVVHWVYSNSAKLLGPFAPAFPATSTGGLVFEWTTLFAIIVYGIIQYFLVRLVVLIGRSSDRDVEHHHHREP